MFTNHTILIVEDEPFIALDIADAIEACGGIVVGPATHIGAALDCLRTHKIDAAVIDGRLIDGDALPVAADLLARDVPFVLFSANGHDAAVARAYPAVTVIVKPASMSTVLDQLHEAIRLAGPRDQSSS